MSSLIDSVAIYTTGPDKSKLKASDIALLDVEGVKRDHLFIRWKDVTDEVCILIRDILKTEYQLPFKWLQSDESSYEYVAQKRRTSGGMTGIRTADVTVEPLNRHYSYTISRIPINQKLPIGTIVTLNNTIPYELDDGTIPSRKFIHSGLLKFEGKDLPERPILDHCHIGSQEVGSIIRARYTVEYVDNERGKFRLWQFRRSDDDKLFVISLWHMYGLSIQELLTMMINYVKTGYKEPVLYKVGANDYGHNILNQKVLLEFLESVFKKVEKMKPVEISIDEFEQKEHLK